MAQPATREEFKRYCLRRLGDPVIEINVDDDQVEDRINDSLSYFYDYHFDGTEKQYYKYGPINPTDLSNKYITLPDNIIGAVRIFPIGMALSTNNLFNIRYQIALNDLYDLTSTTMVPYYMAMQHIQFLEQLLVGEQPIRFQRHMNKLYIDMDWGKINLGEYLVIEAYSIIDPDVYPDIWKDRWLQRYATAMIKQQWGANLTKFRDIALPGGQKFNADKIYNDATKELADLESEMQTSYSLPSAMMLG